jgi:hypothetical protein
VSIVEVRHLGRSSVAGTLQRLFGWATRLSLLSSEFICSRAPIADTFLQFLPSIARETTRKVASVLALLLVPRSAICYRQHRAYHPVGLHQPRLPLLSPVQACRPYYLRAKSFLLRGLPVFSRSRQALLFVGFRDDCSCQLAWTLGKRRPIVPLPYQIRQWS